jgi:hypothetical protein
VDAFLHLLAFQTRFSPPQLLPVRSLPLRDLDRDVVLNNDCSARSIPGRAVSLEEVEIVGLSYLCSDHLQKGHQKDHPIFEVNPLDVSQVELRNVSEAFDGKHPHVVEDPFDFSIIWVNNAIPSPVEASVFFFRGYGPALVAKRKEGSHYVHRAYSLSDFSQSLGAAEPFVVIEQDSVALGVAVLSDCHFDVPNRVEGGVNDHIAFVFELRIIVGSGGEDDLLPLLIGLPRGDVKCVQNLIFVELLHDDDAQFYLPFGKRVDEDLFVGGSIEDPREYAFGMVVDDLIVLVVHVIVEHGLEYFYDGA